VDDLNKKRFLLGILFAWAPWVPTIVGLRYAFRGISNTKATGLGVLIGWLAEAFVLWGAITMVIAEIAAIVYLARAFSAGHGLRNFLAAFSMLLSGLMLLFVCLFIGGAMWLRAHH
jgi:biopolymer transport protein ExbB/TolQ